MNCRFTKVACLVLVLWLVAALLVACQPIRPETAQAQAALSEKERFTLVVMAQEAAYANNDLESFFSLFAETVSMPPDAVPTTGKTQLAAAMKALFDSYEVNNLWC